MKWIGNNATKKILVLFLSKKNFPYFPLDKKQMWNEKVFLISYFRTNLDKLDTAYWHRNIFGYWKCCKRKHPKNFENSWKMHAEKLEQIQDWILWILLLKVSRNSLYIYIKRKGSMVKLQNGKDCLNLDNSFFHYCQGQVF